MALQIHQIELSKNEWTALKSPTFYHATDGKPAHQKTYIELMADEQFLHIRFHAQENYYTHQNTYQTHNEPLYNQEVFEVFISAGAETPSHYLEVELNPNDKLWIGKIENLSQDAGGNKILEMLDYQAAKILHSVEIQESSWSGSLSIPFFLIGNSAVYRLNFYRIVATKPHENSDWICDTETCDFLCWSPTLSGENPAFHRPKYFGTLHIK